MTQGPSSDRTNVRPLLTLAAMLAIAVVGASVQVVFPGDQAASFFDLPEARAWVLANSALLALAVGVGVWTYPSLSWWARGASTRFILAIAAVYLALLIVTMFLPEESAGDLQHPVAHHGMRVAFLVFVVMLGAFPPFAVMLLITARLPSESYAAPVQLDIVLRARADLDRALAALASLLTAAVVATSACPVALDAWGGGTSLSAYAVVAYGGYLSALIAAAYVPSRLVWRAAGSTLRDEMYPLPQSSAIGREWLSDRQAVDN